MGVQQSSVHFENLNGVIENQSGYEIKYKVIRPFNTKVQDKSMTQKLNEPLEQEKILEDEENFLYAGLVSPYSTKYFSFNDVYNAYKFSVFAIKLNNQSVQEIVPLQKQLKINSQKSICLRVTPQLKVIHMSSQEIKQFHSRKFIESQILKQSKIVKSTQLSHRLVCMFSQKCPSKLQIIYRASQHQFDVKRFYELHGKKDNILLLCKTNKGKIIGAYSRMGLIPSQENSLEYDGEGWTGIHDGSNSSFIFSLTCNDIFRLKEGQVAVYYNKDQQLICFGKDELRINNFSNKNGCLSQNINTNYQNHNYNNDTGSYLLLNGNQSPSFTTQEWEIYQLIFGQENTVSYEQELTSTLIDL